MPDYIDEQVVLEEVSESEPNAVPLRHIMKAIGGLEGVKINYATGTAHHLSLQQWADRDPDKTFFRFGFRWIDPKELNR